MTQNNKSENSFFAIHDFMVTELNLSGTELLVYALIYSYTNNGKYKCYCGSLETISKRTNVTVRSVSNALKKLCDKNLIEKHYPKSQKVGAECYYKSIRLENISNRLENFSNPIENFSNNNKEDNKEDNKDIECIKWNFSPKEIKSYSTFSHGILHRQIIKCMRLIGYDDNDYIQKAIYIVDYYYSTYMDTFDEEHPRLSEKAMCSMLERLVLGSNMTEDNDLDIDMYMAMIDRHFKTYYGGSGTDYNICHFMTEEVRNNRFYETCY